MECAVVQFKANADTIEENLVRMESFVRSASHAANVIVFPEQFLTAGADERIDDGRLVDRFAGMAREYGIDIVAGSILERTPRGVVNVSYYVDPQGVCGRYEKVNLWRSERSRITPGSDVAVFDTRFGRVGLAICWDLMYPELFSRMAHQGADVVFCPSLWWRGSSMAIHRGFPDAQKVHLDAVCTARAIENSIAIVYANVVGPVRLEDGFDEGVGQSMITMPVRGVVRKLDEEEAMVIERIDIRLLELARRSYGLGRSVA